MSAAEHLELALPGGFAPNRVRVAGDGPPVVYLHGAFGPDDDPRYLEALAAAHRVWAPTHPGTDEPADLERLDHLFDLVLYYDDLLDALGLGEVTLVGHSFGGMVAAELAATFRHRVRRLVLIDPLGLWRDDAPVADYVVLPPDEQPALLFRDPGDAVARGAFVPPLAGGDSVDATLRRIAAVAGTSHFVWPIPERGLAKRLRRITAPTLLLWGRDDAVVDVSYAQDFAGAIGDATVRVLEGAGHHPHVEQCEQAAAATLAFLDA